MSDRHRVLFIPTTRRRDASQPDLLRRRTLSGLGLMLAGSAASGPLLAQATGQCVLAAEVGEGPFYFDPRLLRSDIRDGMPGAPLTVRMRILDERSCEPVPGARVDMWQADGVGLYSGYTNQRGTGAVPPSHAAGQTWLRGTQFCNDDGHVDFTTIFPSWYRGRTPHIHFKVILDDEEVVASQIFFPEDLNQEIMRNWDPYREHIAQQDTRNDNDTFLRGRTGGVFSEVVESGSDGFGVSLEAAIRSST